MISRAQRQSLAASGCSVLFDHLTLQLYATDASIYQVLPWAVAFPRSPHEAAAIIQAASGLPVIPRGAGTGLVGGAIGEGLVVDFSKHNRQISELNLDDRSVRVGPGVVLDQLNAFLKPHGFGFGPDVATSSRATLGGMIANNSSGARVPVYGTTADHVRSLDLVLADGSLATIGRGHDTLRPLKQQLVSLIDPLRDEIRLRMADSLPKRWAGYALNRWLNDPGNLNNLLAGSEGTLAAIVSAQLNITPLPRHKGLGLIFFSSIAEAMQATVELLDLQPAAIEHIDRILFDQTRGQLPFQAARHLLQLDTLPCESILIVEFHDDVASRLELLRQRRLGLRTTLCTDPAEMNLVWSLRKAGLSLLTGRPGRAKPTTGIEDTVVHPRLLPEYVAALQKLLASLQLEACFYGHAAAGLLHVRPVLDLHHPGDLKKFRLLADEVSALVRQFKGSLAGEHGVGIARTEYLRDHLGDSLLEAMRGIKAAFDPHQRFNPGKIVGPPEFKIDDRLRIDPSREIQLPFQPVLAFAAKDHSFVANLEQCNGCGGCRKDAPTMCPTFVATGDEIMSTRGRANAIRAALDGRGSDRGHALRDTGLDIALSSCLSCKACTTECPSNVNLALLKAELLHAKHQRHGLPLLQRILGSVDALGKLGCLTPGLANDLLQHPGIRGLLQRALGLAARRPFPPYAEERFDHWFNRRSPGPKPAQRGTVLLWDDTFVRYHEPHIGRAAVHVLEAAGFQVILVRDRVCCGRPAFSQGWLDEAARLGRHNLARLGSPGTPPVPILFLEPSCWSMFAEDYRELRLPGADAIASRSVLFEQFLADLLRREPDALAFQTRTDAIAIHAHCHAKALVNPSFMTQLAGRLTDAGATLLDTGCCGMAGAFGALESKYDLSLQIARPLVQQIHSLPPKARLVASGTSCRHQIAHLSPVRPLHMAELLSEAVGPQ